MSPLYGALLAFWGTMRSEVVVYRLLVARSRILWGERVHAFYQVVGGVLVFLGGLWAFGVLS